MIRKTTNHYLIVSRSYMTTIFTSDLFFAVSFRASTLSIAVIIMGKWTATDELSILSERKLPFCSSKGHIGTWKYSWCYKRWSNDVSSIAENPEQGNTWSLFWKITFRNSLLICEAALQEIILLINTSKYFEVILDCTSNINH